MRKFIPHSATGVSLVKGSAHCNVPQLSIQGIGISYQPSDTIISPAVTHMLIKRIFLWVQRSYIFGMGISKNDRSFNLLASAFSWLRSFWRYLQLCKFIRVLQKSKCKAHHTIIISAVKLLPIFVYLLCQCILSFWVGTALYTHIFPSRNLLKLLSGYMNSLLIWTFSAADPSDLQIKTANHWSGLCTGEQQWPAAAVCPSLESTSDKAN